MTPDADLLRLYADRRSEAAFAELVNRHLGLVYSAALRQLAGDTHRAQDVSQLVFTDLARKAARLATHPALSAWLYQSTRYAVAGIVRTESRRKNREQAAETMREIHATPEPPPEWARLGPVIDEVICTLSDSEQQAVCLRFFSGQSYAEIAVRSHITADAARFRVDRALEKMRGQLSRRGVSSTTAALAVVLETQLCSAAPSGMAAAVAGAASAGAGAPAVSAVLQLMATYKQVGIAAALAAAAIIAASLEVSRRSGLRSQIAALAEQVAPLPATRAENKRLQQRRASLAAARSQAAPAGLATGTERGANTSGSSAPGLAGGLTKRDGLLLDQQPTLLDMVAPTYPADLLGSGVAGTVRMEFVINDTGTVASAFAKRPGDAPMGGASIIMSPFGTKSPSPLPADISDAVRHEIEHAAIKSVAEAVFRPGRRGGREINARVEIDMQVGPPESFIPPTQ